MLYSQRVWNNMGEDANDRVESTYSAARSESPSIYSRRGWGDSTVSLHQPDDLDGRHSFAPSMQTANAEDEHDDVDPVEDTQADDDIGAGTLQRGLSVMGPKTRFVTPAPWEPGGEDDLQEEDDENNDAETRSIFSGRGRSKKPKESANKTRGFPASFTPRASSSSRPSEDVSTPTSSSSGGRFRHKNRPGSIGTANSNTSELPFPSPRYERPVIASMRRDRTDSTASHPYANPDNIPSPLPYQERFPPSPVNQHNHQSNGFPVASKMHSSEYASNPQAASTPTNDPHSVPPPGVLPTKMTPWQFTPSSPTFQLVSLEEAQAMKARQRQMSFNTNAAGTNEASVRTRAISAGNRKPTSPMEPTAFGSSEDVSAPKQVLKGRKSLLGLFAKAREKERSVTPRSESPPPMPSLPTTTTPSPRMQNLPSPMASAPLLYSASPTPTPTPQETTHVKPSSKRVPPPSLNVVVTSPQLPDTQESTHVQPPSIHHVQKSATTPPAIPSTLSTPRKKNSTATLSPVEKSSSKPSSKPNSAPSNVQGFTGLSLRPISTMFTSMPADYLTNMSSPPAVPSYMSTSSTGPFSTQSPTTPSLISSRSESISTGSSEQPPSTASGLLQTMSASSSTEGGHSLSLLQKQVYGAREVWRNQISDLEAQVRALQAEVAALKRTPCPNCGHLGGGCSGGEEKVSVVNRPRAKTAAGASRTLFGNAD